MGVSSRSVEREQVAAYQNRPSVLEAAMTDSRILGNIGAGVSDSCFQSVAYVSRQITVNVVRLADLARLLNVDRSGTVGPEPITSRSSPMTSDRTSVTIVASQASRAS